MGLASDSGVQETTTRTICFHHLSKLRQFAYLLIQNQRILLALGDVQQEILIYWKILFYRVSSRIQIYVYTYYTVIFIMSLLLLAKLIFLKPRCDFNNLLFLKQNDWFSKTTLKFNG